MRTVSLPPEQASWPETFHGLARQRVIVLVPSPPCQRRVLRSLPPVSQRALQTLVETNLTRFFPLSRSPLVVTATWVREKRQPGFALAYAIAETISQSIVDLAKAASCNAVDIRPEGEGPRCSLLPRREIERRRRIEMRRGLWRIVLTIALIPGSLVVAAAGQRAIRSAAARTGPDVTELRLARDRLDRSFVTWRAESAFASDRDRNHRVVAMLAAAVGSLGERDQLTSLQLSPLQVTELGVLSPDADRTMAAFGRALPSLELPASQEPTLVRRGTDVWTHLVLRPRGTVR